MRATKSKNARKQKSNKKNHIIKRKNRIQEGRNISQFDEDMLNEELRIHKTGHGEGKGSWKVLPKDSCELYKNRQNCKINKCNPNENDITPTVPTNMPVKKKRTVRIMKRKYRLNKSRYVKNSDADGSSTCSCVSTNGTNVINSSCTSYSDIN